MFVNHETFFILIHLFVMRVLYLTYDGLTDPLGQSQVLPYLVGLSLKGHEITIISAEKKSNFKLNFITVNNSVKKHNINWLYFYYTSKPPVLSTVFDLVKLYFLAKKQNAKNKFQLIHCRSYITSIIGLIFKRKYNVPFVFDMRGFWADERVDGLIWNLKNPLYKWIYNYFKNKEKAFINEANAIISLTDKGKIILEGWQYIPCPPPIYVIPCCVDTDLFDFNKFNDVQKQGLKDKWHIASEDKIICYLGSLGTWYMPNEMMQFVQKLLNKYSNFKFLILTYDDKEHVLAIAQNYHIPHEKLIIYKAHRNEIPLLLSIVDLSLFFIKPVFSKKASSPTKQAEVMSMGVPLICNDGIGDTTEIIRYNNLGFVLNSFDDKNFEEALNQMEIIMQLSKEHIRETALNLFSLNSGINKYNEIYTLINTKRHA